ncbi:MAG: hypothetical protein HUU23_02445 [Caldilineales bacterium]|nr:hypothetical protein [Caldilineales bacterium]
MITRNGHAIEAAATRDIIVAAAQRLPQRAVQEDADLLMVYDHAAMRMETA